MKVVVLNSIGQIGLTSKHINNYVTHSKVVFGSFLAGVTLDHFQKSESPSFDSLNERFYGSDNIP